jgi:DNA-binding NtrC family response regulator
MVAVMLMADERTVPRRIQGLPIRAFRVEVVAGPDLGKVAVSHDAATVGTADGNDLQLADKAVSRYHLELQRRNDRILVTDLGSTNGTDLGSAVLEGSRALVLPGATVTVGETKLRIDDGDVVLVDQRAPDAVADLKGRSLAMRKLYASILKVAESKVPVLLCGESGTGKELIARAIHGEDDPQKPFATVDCAATVPSLFASELFGYERGAFTGADKRSDGAFLRAHGGTIFLDEIGELSMDLQSALLGVLERRRVRRVGGHEEIPIDVRVISATHRDLRSEVNAGRFRLDLYYRLAVVMVQVPPLRDRATDIPLLVEHFLRQAGHEGPVEQIFPPAAMAELARHTWPGNVRELRNVVEAALVMGAPQSFDRSASFGPPSAPPPMGSASTSYRDARREVLEAFERDYLTQLLARTTGNVRQAAREARMDRSYLIELLKRHKLG